MIKVAIIAWILVLVMYEVFKFYLTTHPEEVWAIHNLNRTSVGVVIASLMYVGSWIFAIVSTIIAVIKFGG